MSTWNVTIFQNDWNPVRSIFPSLASSMMVEIIPTAVVELSSRAMPPTVTILGTTDFSIIVLAIAASPPLNLSSKMG